MAKSVETGWGDLKAAAVVATSIRALAPARDTCTITDDMRQALLGAGVTIPIESLAVAGCVDGWARLEIPDELGDTAMLMRRVEGKWTFYTGFPTGISRSKYESDGGPSAFSSMFPPR